MVQGLDLVELVRQAAAGDVSAHAALTATFSPLARATASRLVNDPHSAEDVVQEALAEVFATIDRIRHPEAFPALVRLAVRKHAERHRRRNRPTDSLVDGVGPSTVGADVLVEQRAVVDLVRAALCTMRDSDRRLLELRYLADWSIADLATAFGLTEGAVRKRLHDARRRLRPAVHDLDPRKDTTMTDFEPLLGHVYRPGDLPQLEAAPPVARPATREPVATGLKILDTIAPVARGGTVEMVGPAGTGHLVLVLELSYRLGRTERESAIVAVASSQQSVGAWSNLGKLVTDLPEHDRHAVILSDDAEGARLALGEGANLARGLAGGGVDVLLVVDVASAAAVGGVAALKDLAGVSSGGGSVTLILLDPYAREAELPADRGLETRLVFTGEHLALGIFPALDPVESRSTFDDSELAAEVRQLLRTSNQVRRYFNQPMVVAEDHTGEPPTWVDRADAEQELRQLLAARS